MGSDHLVLVTCRTQPDGTKVLYRAQGITPKFGFYESR
jgi:hypothetical protein